MLSTPVDKISAHGTESAKHEHIRVTIAHIPGSELDLHYLVHSCDRHRMQKYRSSVCSSNVRRARMGWIDVRTVLHITVATPAMTLRRNGRA